MNAVAPGEGEKCEGVVIKIRSWIQDIAFSRKQAGKSLFRPLPGSIDQEGDTGRGQVSATVPPQRLGVGKDIDLPGSYARALGGDVGVSPGQRQLLDVSAVDIVDAVRSPERQ